MWRVDLKTKTKEKAMIKKIYFIFHTNVTDLMTFTIAAKLSEKYYFFFI